MASHYSVESLQQTLPSDVDNAPTTNQLHHVSQEPISINDKEIIDIRSNNLLLMKRCCCAGKNEDYLVN